MSSVNRGKQNQNRYFRMCAFPFDKSISGLAHFRLRPPPQNGDSVFLPEKMTSPFRKSHAIYCVYSFYVICLVTKIHNL